MKTFIIVLLGICASFFIMTIVLWVSEVYDIYNLPISANSISYLAPTYIEFLERILTFIIKPPTL